MCRMKRNLPGGLSFQKSQCFKDKTRQDFPASFQKNCLFYLLQNERTGIFACAPAASRCSGDKICFRARKLFYQAASQKYPMKTGLVLRSTGCVQKCLELFSRNVESGF